MLQQRLRQRRHQPDLAACIQRSRPRSRFLRQPRQRARSVRTPHKQPDVPHTMLLTHEAVGLGPIQQKRALLADQHLCRKPRLGLAFSTQRNDAHRGPWPQLAIQQRRQRLGLGQQRLA